MCKQPVLTASSGIIISSAGASGETVKLKLYYKMKL